MVWKEEQAACRVHCYDWRNKRVTKISTDPAATTNYFQAEGNALPFELSPAFFRPEVLLKYKADRDKYTVGERDEIGELFQRQGGDGVDLGPGERAAFVEEGGLGVGECG